MQFIQSYSQRRSTAFFIFPGLIFQSFFSCSLRISSGTYQTKVIRHGANFPTVFASVGQKAKRRAGVHLSRPPEPGIDYIRHANHSKPIIMVNPGAEGEIEKVLLELRGLKRQVKRVGEERESCPRTKRRTQNPQ